MDSLSKINLKQQPFNLSLDHHRPLFSRPISSISFRTPCSLSWPSSIRLRSIRASSVPFPQTLKSPKTPKPRILVTLKPLLKTTCIAITAAALFLAGSSSLKPAYAEPTKESTEGIVEEERAKALEERLESNPEDVAALRSLLEAKIKGGDLGKAIEILDRLIVLEPDEREWPLMRAHTLIHNREPRSAILGFEEMLAKDPFLVEAYHGLVMAFSNSEEDLDGVMKRIEEAMERCKKEKKMDTLRDFKLLVAQILVLEGEYLAALKVYQELVKEEPRDFRPYLCQGMIYSLLRKKDEAHKQFEKYKRLVPKGHPYAEFFDDNMMATRILSPMADDQGAGQKS